MSHNGQLVYSSYLVILPPPEYWEPIVEIKKNHMNPRIKRAPYPHISLLAPFYRYRDFDSIIDRIHEVADRYQPFQMRLNDVKLFENHRNATMYLHPETDDMNILTDLQKSLSDAFPEVQQYLDDENRQSNFKPHFGLGFFKNIREAKRMRTRYQRSWNNIEFTVQELYLVTRTSNTAPFTVRKVIPLGGSTNLSLFEEIPE
eukprot:TRINITY_DN6430_c0_g1_i1.p1 TRINITY_DN6430_c0_g1~~TRINITY_DN6430_c0_g1_i1.p1  ORF type:complete len:202 (-),score=25.30 TRINITY_DN6430_c0_g1_i1:24-629(-)